MARLHVMERSEAQAVMDGLHEALGKRLAVSSLAPCPVEFTAAYVRMCATQSCGKCTPCRVGLRALADLLDAVLENRADEKTLGLIERTARAIYLSADCAIGYEAGEMALTAIRGFHDDFVHHIDHHACGFTQSQLVPCVSGCPAGVDIPGYIALVEAGRNTDAVRLIRKDNPLPVVCGLVCEHPCEINCRRGMVDDPMNIRGIKRYACDHMEAGYTPNHAAPTGKRVAVIGGGPAGLSAAYYLALMGHSPKIFEARHKLGGMLRYTLARWFVPVPGGWPVATMIANVLGSFAIGLVAALLVARAPENSENLRLFCMTGVLGGFTTYSAFALESSLLLGGGQTLRAIAYIATTVIVCLAAVLAGRAVVSLLAP